MRVRSPVQRAASRPGFTLVELLVVLVILGLLASVAAPQAMRYLGGAKHDAAKLQLQGLMTAVDLYRLDVGRYPTREEGLAALMQRPAGVDRWNGPYVRKADQLQDPWSRPYRYRFPGENGVYDLIPGAPYALRIVGLDHLAGATGMSFTAAVSNAGAAVTGLSAVSVTATVASTNATGNQLVAVGGLVTVTISAVAGAPTGGRLVLRFTRA